MKINKVEFVISAVSPAQYPEGALPEIALAGRSNVGKSSFINTMLQRKSVARISSKPGKTRTINYFLVNDKLYFVDLPGYGFARVSKTEKEKWGKMMEEYFQTREPLKVVVLLVDVRHEPTKDDQAMYEYLKHYQIPVIVIATKADKISRGSWQKQLKLVRQTLKMAPDDTLILFSSETGQGREETWKELLKRI
jgi:GTP-binding protein